LYRVLNYGDAVKSDIRHLLLFFIVKVLNRIDKIGIFNYTHISLLLQIYPHIHLIKKIYMQACINIDL